MPGIQVNRDGFQVAQETDEIRLYSASRIWKPLETTDIEQIVDLDHRVFNPWKVRLNLLAPGFAYYCPQGLRLKLKCDQAPYLSWQEGSVSDGVPTPALRWAVLSFRDAQSPLMFGFVNANAVMKIDGRSGDWTISIDDYVGWIRIGQLIGAPPEAANTAASLGHIAMIAAAEASVFTNPPPTLKGLDLDSDLMSVTATWRFDRPLAIVPSAVTLAGLGGYPIQVSSGRRVLDAAGPDGPIEVLTGTTLTVRFPVLRIPTGRGLAAGDDVSQPITSAAPQDIPSVVELALENLVCSRDRLTRNAGQQTSDEYFNQTQFVAEPWTGVRLPFDGNRGIDLAAAQSLLTQALTSSAKASSEANSLLTSVTWCRDWGTWQVWSADPVVARRTTALAAVAGALCPEPERRLEAAMLQAGMSAQRGLELWRVHRGLGKQPATLLEPLLGLRQGIFGLIGLPDPDRAFVASLASPIRVYGETPVQVSNTDAGLTLRWPVLETKPSLLTFASAYPLELFRGEDLDHFAVVEAFGLTEIHYIPETAGECSARLVLPTWAKPLPSAVAPPRYREPSL